MTYTLVKISVLNELRSDNASPRRMQESTYVGSMLSMQLFRLNESSYIAICLMAPFYKIMALFIFIQKMIFAVDAENK